VQIETEHFGQTMAGGAVEVGESEFIDLSSVSFPDEYCPWWDDGDGN
jgi:hypothetical protein